MFPCNQYILNIYAFQLLFLQNIKFYTLNKLSVVFLFKLLESFPMIQKANRRLIQTAVILICKFPGDGFPVFPGRNTKSLAEGPVKGGVIPIAYFTAYRFQLPSLQDQFSGRIHTAFGHIIMKSLIRFLLKELCHRGNTYTEMIRHILCKNGIPAASIGTVGVRIGDTVTPTGNTTPESYELFRIFAEMVEKGICYAVIEVSSQGIKLDRVFGIPFFAAVMTNLSEDHIGGAEHPDFEDYKACKKALFSRCEHALFNADDPYFEEFWESAPCEKKAYSISEEADIFAKSILSTATEKGFGSSFILKHDGKKTDAFVPFPGEFSVSNALAAVGVAMLADVSAESAVDALSDVRVAGRFEIVPTALGATFVIDYAHNGESLTAALNALRKYRPNRLICLFGSVGGRTEIRRRELGVSASAYADFSILTSDNPDKEPPLDIIADIERYMQNAPYAVIPDRKEAIEYAVSIAEEGDIVLLAGKGHETYQLVGGKKEPFCEREILTVATEKLALSNVTNI